MQRALPDAVFGAGLATPALLVTLALLAFPLGYSLWISLHQVTFGGSVWRFVGLDNYVSVIRDPLFWPSLTRTLSVAITAIALTSGLGLAFALLLTEDFPGRNWLRAVLILPWSISQVMLALTFGWMFNSTFGPLNGLLFQLHVIDGYIAWFANGRTVLGIMSIAIVWNLVPFATLLFLGSLQTVPEELGKAARVDGAGAIRRFWLITLPWISPTALVVVIISALSGFLVFTPIYVLTGGGPGTETVVLAWWGYSTGFHDLDLGKSAAIFYILSVLIAAVSFATLRALGRSSREGPRS